MTGITAVVYNIPGLLDGHVFIGPMISIINQFQGLGDRCIKTHSRVPILTYTIAKVLSSAVIPDDVVAVCKDVWREGVGRQSDAMKNRPK